MNKEKFWQLIQRVHVEGLDDMDKKSELIKEALAKLSADEVIGFQTLFDEQMDKAYSWELWGAAYVIGGGCSDDAFTDFRSALISRGETSFKAVLANPDSLAEQTLDEDTLFYEGFQYAVSEGVEAAADSRPERYKPHPSEPSGEEWADDEDSLKSLYPKLWAKVAEQYNAEPVSHTINEKLPLRENPEFRIFIKLQVFAVCAILILYIVNKFLLS